MKDSISLHDEFLKQSIDLLNGSNALQDLVFKPLKRRIFPIVAVAGLVNLLILVLLFYILSQLTHLRHGGLPALSVPTPGLTVP